MINKLTDEQISKFHHYVKKWTEIGLCTDKADRKLAEQSILESYRCAGISEPKKIIWCSSPLSQGFVRVIYLNNYEIKNSVSASISDSVGASVRASVRDSVRASVRDSVLYSVWASVRDSFRDSVLYSVWASVRDSFRDSVLYSVRDSVGASVRTSVWDSVRASVWDSVRHSVSDSVWDSVMHSVSDSVRTSVRDSVSDYVWDSVRTSVWDSVGNSVWDSVYGQHEAHWLAFYEYFYEVLGLKSQTEKLKGLWGMAKSCGWIIPHEEICFASERHSILNIDNNGRIHSLTEPAIMYPDGWSIYAVHGVRVTEKIIKYPEKITTSEIDSESNAEIRRVMIDQYDREFKGRYLIDSGAKKISSHLDQFGREKVLFFKEIKNDEPIVMLKVINSTAEPEGNFKEYFLRVPPDIRDSREADAWTFYQNKDNYNPISET